MGSSLKKADAKTVAVTAVVTAAGLYVYNRGRSMSDAQVYAPMKVGRVSVPVGSFTSKEAVVKKLREAFTDKPDPKFCEKIFIDGVPTLKAYPSPTLRVQKTIILFIHGGLYIAGNSQSYADILSQYTAQTKYPIYSLDYSLCPEAGIEQSLKEVTKVYKSLRRTCHVHLVGDGAGANLICRMLGNISSNSHSAPSSVALFSLIKDFSSSPLRDLAELCLVEEPEELKQLDVSGTLDSISAYDQFEGDDINDSKQVSEACVMIENGGGTSI